MILTSSDPNPGFIVIESPILNELSLDAESIVVPAGELINK
jgi:hypothetical protein